MSIADLNEERERLGISVSSTGRSIAERAAEDPLSQRDLSEEELFPHGSVDGDGQVDWRNLVPPGASVKLECNLSSAKVPLRSGLYPFGRLGEVIVTFEAGKVQNVPEFGEEGSNGSRDLEGVMLRQVLRAVHVRDAGKLYTREQVEEILSAVDVDPSSERARELLGT